MSTLAALSIPAVAVLCGTAAYVAWHRKLAQLRRDEAAARAQLQQQASVRLDDLALDGMSHLSRIGELEEEIARLKARIRSLEQRSEREHEILALAATEPPIHAATLTRRFAIHDVVAQQHIDELVRALFLQPYPQPKGGYQISPRGRAYLREHQLPA